VGRPGTGRHQRIVEISREIVQSLRPAVPLIPDKAEQHPQRMCFGSALVIEIELQETQKWRRG